MKVKFPAMRGKMGGREYYSCQMRLNTIPKMFTYRDWAEFTPEQREQRVLETKRIPELARYILQNESNYIFASITASYKCAVEFFPTKTGSAIGELEMDFEDANFVINDGQHRCAAIAAALKENPSLSEESISVLLFPYESLDRVQQMFSDLNRFVKKTSKSLDILYDKRDLVSKVTLAVVEKVGVFKGFVDKDVMSLPTRSPKLFTLSAIYDANGELLGHIKEEGVAAAIAQAEEFWTAVSKVIPGWLKVKNGDLKAIELRQEYISAHSVVLRALGSLGADLIAQFPSNWKEKLLDLSSIDWRKVNPEWENVCIVANSVISNRQARLATKAYLKNKMGLVLSEAEQKAISHHLAAVA